MSFNNNNNNFYYNSTVDTKSYSYQKNCLTGPIQSSAIGAILFSALDAFQGVPIQQVIKPQKLGTYFGAMYLYHAMQCPMEGIHGRTSLWHNIISGGTIGFFGYTSGRLGIPFIGNPELIFYKTGIPPYILAFTVYGTLSGLLAGGLGNKRF